MMFKLKCFKLSWSCSGSISKHSASVPTTGSNIVNVQKMKNEQDQQQAPDSVSIREIGGSMAPIWKNMVESGMQSHLHIHIKHRVHPSVHSFVLQSITLQIKKCKILLNKNNTRKINCVIVHLTSKINLIKIKLILANWKTILREAFKKKKLHIFGTVPKRGGEGSTQTQT